MIRFLIFSYLFCVAILLGRVTLDLYRDNRHVDSLHRTTVWDVAGPCLLVLLCYMIAVLVMA